MLPGTLMEICENAFNDYGNLKTVWVEENCALDVRRYVGKDVELHYK